MNKKMNKKMNITKPLCAHQYYMKAWKNLTDEEKQPFIEKANQDKERYIQEKKIQDDIKKEETKKLEIFISRSYGRVSCVGMDNGWSNYEVIGPAEGLIEHTEEDKEKLRKLEIKERYIPKYKTIIIAGLEYTYDKKTVKKYNYTAYRGAGLKWSVSSTKKQEHYTVTYNHNMCGDKTWRTENEPAWYAVKD